MKSIETLVEDIYGLFGAKRFTPDRGNVERFTTKLVERICNRLAEERAAPTLRLSNLGTPCDRKLWYYFNTPEKGEKLDAPAEIKFMYGDILEEMLLFLAREAGHTVEDEQKEVELHGVLGHIDGRIDGILVDCKSAASPSFDKFSKGLTGDKDSFGYLTQLDAYLNALGGDEACFLVIDKQLGKLCLDKHNKNDVDYKLVVEHKKKMLAEPNPPFRKYEPEPDGKSGNMKLGVTCSYCPFKNTCWPGLRTFAYANGPRFLTKVVRQPDVPEIV